MVWIILEFLAISLECWGTLSSVSLTLSPSLFRGGSVASILASDLVTTMVKLTDFLKNQFQAPLLLRSCFTSNGLKSRSAMYAGEISARLSLARLLGETYRWSSRMGSVDGVICWSRHYTTVIFSYKKISNLKGKKEMDSLLFGLMFAYKDVIRCWIFFQRNLVK